MKKLLILLILLSPIASHAEVVTYTMQSDDTISSVAEKFGVERSSIWDNELDPTTLYIELPEPVSGDDYEDDYYYDQIDLLETELNVQKKLNEKLQEKITLLEQLVALLTTINQLQHGI